MPCLPPNMRRVRALVSAATDAATGLSEGVVLKYRKAQNNDLVSIESSKLSPVHVIARLWRGWCGRPGHSNESALRALRVRRDAVVLLPARKTPLVPPDPARAGTVTTTGDKCTGSAGLMQPSSVVHHWQDEGGGGGCHVDAEQATPEVESCSAPMRCRNARPHPSGVPRLDVAASPGARAGEPPPARASDGGGGGGGGVAWRRDAVVVTMAPLRTAAAAAECMRVRLRAHARRRLARWHARNSPFRGATEDPPLRVRIKPQ
eukprot:scaffold7446_cov403-Prasinococcus_capsulatus_cf.AAC.5